MLSLLSADLLLSGFIERPRAERGRGSAKASQRAVRVVEAGPVADSRSQLAAPSRSRPYHPLGARGLDGQGEVPASRGGRRGNLEAAPTSPRLQRAANVLTSRLGRLAKASQQAGPQAGRPADAWLRRDATRPRRRPPSSPLQSISPGAAKLDRRPAATFLLDVDLPLSLLGSVFSLSPSRSLSRPRSSDWLAASSRWPRLKLGSAHLDAIPHSLSIRR